MNALEIKNLSVSFLMYDRGVKKKALQVISDLNITLRAGEIHAIAGSSGSGKSLLAHAILGILPKNATTNGEMNWFGEPLTPALQKKLRGSRMVLVPQSVNYLDPLMRVGKQICKDRSVALETLKKYELDEKAARKYPFELSGGMARRALVATAAATDAKVIIADEPTPGLSPELAESAMARFRALADQGAAILLITHDLDLALRYADRISVFYAGTTVETAKASDFREEDLLRHPYSKALWRAMPQNKFEPTAGTQPYAGNLPSGCVFADRCPMRTEACAVRPQFRTVREGEVCCHHAD
jgi:peptide/nickel transport system ATP-binding protein